VLGAPVIAGRTFDARDAHGSQLVGVVNRTFARHFLGDETHVPQRIQTDTGRGPAVIEVVGVVEDVPYENVVDAPTPALYLARSQFVPDDGRAYLLIAPPGNSTVPIEAIRQALARASPGLSYEIVRPSDSARQGYARERMLATVAAAYVAIAVTIAGLGVFGVMSHTVATRRREFGIRLALGPCLTRWPRWWSAAHHVSPRSAPCSG
jgi:putative ABC transport system permease protein